MGQYMQVRVKLVRVAVRFRRTCQIRVPCTIFVGGAEESLRRWSTPSPQSLPPCLTFNHHLAQPLTAHTMREQHRRNPTATPTDTHPPTAELHLDMNRLLLGHAAASLVAGLSNSPIWNLPLSLYGLYVVGHEGSDGEAVRQVRALNYDQRRKLMTSGRAS